MNRLAAAVARRFVAQELTEEDQPKADYSAGHLYVCPEDGTVFLTRRSGLMHHPYKWDLPGGRSEEGEKDPAKTAVREAEEELHSLPKIAKPIGMHVQTWKKGGEDYNYYIYVYALSEDEKVRWTPKVELDEESAGFKWFKLDELPSTEQLHFNLEWLPGDIKKAYPKLKTASEGHLKFALEATKPRYEHKYWIDLARAPAIREFLASYATADEHGQNYKIQNIYLDNPDLEFFADHVVRHKEGHVKLRVRTYDASNDIFLEVKQKTRGVCSKARNIVPSSMYSTVLRTAASNANRIPFVRIAMAHRSGPIIRLDYDREAYNAAEADGRITIDSNIRFSRHNNFSFSGPPTHQLLPDHVGILELKFSGESPAFMRELVATFGLRRRSISKYCMSVAELIHAHELKQPENLFG